jgi:hypothetical protein
MDPLATDFSALLGRLWGLKSRTFLEYVLESGAPQVVDEDDRRVLEILSEANRASPAIRESLARLYRRRRLRVPAVSWPLMASTYNFVRATALVDPFLRLAAADLPALATAQAALAGAESLDDRLLRGVLSDQIRQLADATGRLEEARGAAKPAAPEAAPGPEEAPMAAPAAAPAGPPWHDESLSLEERMALVKGMGLFEQLYAAMAQTDCTACGYDCEGYARAIFEGTDKDLTKCAPGELETQKMLESLMKGR